MLLRLKGISGSVWYNTSAQALTLRTGCAGSWSYCFWRPAKSNLSQCFATHTVKCFLVLLWNPSCSSLFPLLPVFTLATLATHRKEFVFFPFASYFRCLLTSLRLLLILLFSRQNSLCAQPFLTVKVLQTVHHLGCLL